MSKAKNAKYVPAKQSNTMTYVLGGVAILIVIVVVIGGVLLLSKKEGSPADQVVSKMNAATPSFTLGKSDAKNTIEIFEDPMCPACGSMESQYGEQIIKGIEDGNLRVRYFLLDFLNQSSASKNYSDRAAGSLAAIEKSTLSDEQKQKALLGAHAAMYAKQPTEGSSTDHTDAELATIIADGAKSKGVELPADVTTAITEGKYTSDAAGVAKTNGDLLSDIGGTGTPTVVHNGALVEVKGTWLTDIIG